MIDYGTTHSIERPPVTDVRDTKVFVAENIEEETITQMVYNNETGEEESQEIHGYRFRLLEYTKNEYIDLLQQQLTDTQLAICELYEEMV